VGVTFALINEKERMLRFFLRTPGSKLGALLMRIMKIPDGFEAFGVSQYPTSNGEVVLLPRTIK